MTIIDIANEAGVSTATVSRALNNPEKVSEKTMKKIMQIVEKHNYTLNAAAREMVTKRTRLIGVLIPDISNDYISTVLESFFLELANDGYRAYIAVTNMQEDLELAAINDLKSKRAEAVVLLGNRNLEPTSDHLLVSKMDGSPILRIGNTKCGDFYSLVPDEEEGAFQAAEYLIGLGHRRIAFLSGSNQIDSYYYKRKGFQRALRRHGIVQPEDMLCEIDLGKYALATFEKALELLQKPDRPTAILTVGDRLALGVYKAASLLGLKIPEDLSVIGFGGSPISECMYPGLTTVSQNAQKTGKQAEKYLVKILKDECVANQIHTSTELIVRGSCMKPAL